MEQKTKRTITDVLDYETGECIDANLFFLKPLDEIIVYRSKLQQAIEKFTDPLFGCYYCKQKVRIRGGIPGPHKRKTEIFHFAHLKDSEECHIKTKNPYTKEEVDRIKYNGAKESILHQTLKENIAECLRRNEKTKKEVSNVEVEKVIRDKVANEWKKPDINALFNNKRIAIELQLSTTWLDVITRRQHFYKENGTYIFWLFHKFNENDDERKLTYNDVIYTNNQNAFIFDNDTYELSKMENDLVIKCFYKTYYRHEQTLIENWEHSIIKLSDLTFDEQNFRIFYHDAEKQKKILEQEIEVYISEIREYRRLNDLEEQEKLRKLEQLEEKKQYIKDYIQGKIESKNEIEEKANKSKRKLTELIDFVSNVADYSNKIIKYFTDEKQFNKPFHNYEDLLRSLKVEFEAQIKTVSQTVFNKKQEEESFTKNLLGISKLETKVISGKTYSCIDNFVDWNYIKKNYSQIKIIKKDQVDELFAGEEIIPIRNDYELNRYQYSKDIYFLTDFSSKIVEFNNQKEVIDGIIKQQEILLANVKDKIKTQLELHFQQEIKVVETKLKSYLKKQKKINKEIDEKEIELLKLDKI